MICPKCRSDIPDGSKFCKECGSSISGISRQSETEGRSVGDMRTVAGAVRPEADASLGDVRTLQTSGEAMAAAGVSGAQLAERYEILSEIGRGGFAVVFKARDRKLNREVAVKRLLADRLQGSGAEQSLERFRREAHAIAALNHRNIVAVFDCDRDAEGDYIVMEYVADGTLRDHLKQKGGKLPVEEAVSLVRGIGQGLACAHRHNLIHRDIKPANVLIQRDGVDWVPKIVDFGLARIGTDSELSVSGYGLGTPYYMPPEQRRDAKNVNHTADIYALGKTLYETLTGELPDQVDPDMVPGPLGRVILKCVKVRPEDRFFSVDEFLQALDAACGMAQAKTTAGAAQGEPCPACGAANPSDARFCEKCGAGLFRPCPECAKEMRLSVKFCPACGTDTEGLIRLQEALARMERFQAEKKYSRTIKEAGLVADLGFKPKGANAKKALDAAARLKTAAESAEQRIAALPGLIEHLWEKQNYEAVPPLVDELRTLAGDPTEMADIEGRLSEAREQRETAWWAAQEAQVLALCEKGEHDTARQAASERPAFPPPPGVDRGARAEELQQAVTRSQCVAHKQAAAMALEAQNWDDAVRSAMAALGLAPDDPAAKKQLRQAQSGAASLAKLAEAMSAYQKGGYVACLDLVRRLAVDLGSFKIDAEGFSGTCDEFMVLLNRKIRERKRRAVRLVLGFAAAVVAIVVGGFVADHIALSGRIQWFEACRAMGRIDEALQLADRLGTRYPAAAVWKAEHVERTAEENRKALLARSNAAAAIAKSVDAKALNGESATVMNDLARGPVAGQDWTSPETGMEFVWVPALKIWVGKYEVTNGEYRKKVRDHDSKTHIGDRQPVVYVNFDDTKAFAEWMTQRDRAAGALPADCRYRLPSEQEWQAFAQCGDNREYPWGSSMPPKFGNYCGQETRGIAGSMIDGYDDGSVVTCDVTKSGKNDWGLYGVGGNVWEVAASDASGGWFGAWRGASWGYFDPGFLRCGYRDDFVGSLRGLSGGFRLVLAR